MRRITFLFSCLMAAAGAAGAQQGVTLTGNVLDSLNGRALDGVTVYLTDRTSDRTGLQGQFQLRRVPAEETYVMFRRIGYSPRALRLDLRRYDGRTIDLGTIRLWAVPTEMDEVVVESRLVQRNPRMNEFYRRLKAGHGQYITRQDIWNKNPMVTTELLRAVPGIKIDCAYLTACTPSTLRKTGAVAQGNLSCPMRVLLDGQPVGISLDEIPPAWIAGIEIYRSSAFTPLELMSSRGSGDIQGSSSCGTVAVWTGGDDY